MTVRVVISYFRSGGTLLNRCLGALPGVVIMSEVSPLRKSKSSRLVTVRQQAERWYGIRLKSDKFLESVDELHSICEATSRYLVLRLWVVGEFAFARRGAPAPTYRLSTYRSLCDTFADVRAAALVRDAIDIWISRGCQPPGFFANYRRYVDALLQEQLPIEKYESLCEDPDASMQRICGALKLPFSMQYRRFYEFNRARGDLAVETSRGRGKTRIRRLKRRRIDAHSVQIVESSDDMVAANHALDYPTSYLSMPLESRFVTTARRLRGVLRYRVPRIVNLSRESG